MNNNSCWIVLDDTIDDIDLLKNQYAGFVYKITNMINNKSYIGKKTFWSIHKVYRVVTLKSGIKKKKRVQLKTESDWKTYWSSSNDLQSDVSQLGYDNFNRYILRCCLNRAEMSYYETKYQMECDVLLNPDQWYNGIVSCRINKNHIKHLQQRDNNDNI